MKLKYIYKDIKTVLISAFLENVKLLKLLHNFYDNIKSRVLFLYSEESKAFLRSCVTEETDRFANALH